MSIFLMQRCAIFIRKRFTPSHHAHLSSGNKSFVVQTCRKALPLVWGDPMKPINQFLLDNNLTIAKNPCISPDACLDWPRLRDGLPDHVTQYPHSRFETAHGAWELAEHANGDCAWLLTPCGASRPDLEDAATLADGRIAFPATWENLLHLKNLIQEHNPESTIFPGTAGTLGQSTLGIGARFTTLHWPAVEWAMSALNMGMTANQNSIPRELVYDVDAMLENRLDTVPFPFIGANVPEGHQGQSVEGMSHFCVLSKLKNGFHTRGLPWSFNADHQPIGGKFDEREDALVTGCLLASYITFDLSPELAQTPKRENPAAWVTKNVPAELVDAVQQRVNALGFEISENEFHALLAYVWPAIEKMKQRDKKYAAARAAAFTTQEGRAYLRELSIDELPGLTTQGTTAVMLALCACLDMQIHFVAPAFGFQKNIPYPDNAGLRDLIAAQWEVCKAFNCGIGFHSGSGKSGDNYAVMGEVTGGHLEIKTSGRYTYEMGRALAASEEPSDQALWRDWHAFTVDMAVRGAFSSDDTERNMARSFVVDALTKEQRNTEVFADADTLRQALESLAPSPEHMFWFEYNFLYVLAADGKADKASLGDHTPAGYRQRERFYGITPRARFLYAQKVADYILFLAETTGIVPHETCVRARQRLEALETLDQLLEGIHHPS